MAKESLVKYICSQCGHEEPKWVGRCPECGSWNSFFEEKVSNIKAGKDSKPVMDDQVRKLSDIPYDRTMRVSSGIDELDRVLGGGVMKPSSVLVGGEPGIGKSTIMIQMLSTLARTSTVLYVSGEESPSQVRLRADRLNLDSDNILIFCDTRLEALVDALERIKPEYVIVDSLQTLYASSVGSVSGSPNQIKTCCMELSLLAKKIGASIFFVGHVTKDGSLAGPKIVEHMVDTVLYFEGVESGMRLLRASKNRFGSVDEIGLFEMSNKGLKGVVDPSQYFLSSRSADTLPSGISFTPVVEGSRTFVVEIQALVVPSKSGYQRIYSDKVDSARINRIAAILERHAGVDLSAHDIYINVAGGMKLSEGAIDIAVALALYSSKVNIPLPLNVCSFGELSLAGEVRPVPFFDRRLKSVTDMGFTSPIHASSYKNKDGIGIGVGNIKTAIIAAFKK